LEGRETSKASLLSDCTRAKHLPSAGNLASVGKEGTGPKKGKMVKREKGQRHTIRPHPLETRTAINVIMGIGKKTLNNKR